MPGVSVVGKTAYPRTSNRVSRRVVALDDSRTQGGSPEVARDSPDVSEHSRLGDHVLPVPRVRSRWHPRRPGRYRATCFRRLRTGAGPTLAALPRPFFMPLLTRRAARYARAWLRSPVACEEVETTLHRGETPVPATLIRPDGSRSALPGWVVLHGMTRAGRAHEQLLRFTRSLVSSGVVAIVPEVPEWRRLSLSPHLATPTVKAAIDGLRASSWVVDQPVGVIGFSFGAPHAIGASSDPELSAEIAGSVGFGGYCEIESTFRFMMTGSAELGSGPSSKLPDPYGRWIVASNYLTEIPELSDHGDVETALRDLAAYAADLGDPSWDGVYDPVISQLRDRLSPARRRLFDLFAPPAGVLPDRKAAAEIAERLAAAARLKDPLLDATARLGRVERPVHILHGRYDRLISCAEAAKLQDALPPTTWSQVTITRLFGHSGHDRFPLLSALYEVPRFARALSGMLAVA